MRCGILGNLREGLCPRLRSVIRERVPPDPVVNFVADPFPDLEGEPGSYDPVREDHDIHSVDRLTMGVSIRYHPEGELSHSCPILLCR